MRLPLLQTQATGGLNVVFSSSESTGLPTLPAMKHTYWHKDKFQRCLQLSAQRERTYACLSLTGLLFNKSTVINNC